MEKRISFNVEDILPYIKKAIGVVPSKALLPAYESLLFEVSSDCVSITASDSDIHFIEKIRQGFEVQEPFSFLVHARTFHQALSSISQGKVTMLVDDERHELRCDYGVGSFTLPIGETDDYPRPRIVELTTDYWIAGDLLGELIDATEYACANDTLRPQLCCVRMDIVRNSDGIDVIGVGTDGQRLVRYKTNDYDENADTQGVCLPRKAALILRSLCDVEDDIEVEVAFCANRAVFSWQDWTLTMRLPEGRFPNYNSVIPKSFNYVIEIDKREFVAALKRVLPFGNAVSNLVVLEIEKGSMRMLARDYDLATSAESTLPCAYDGDLLRFGFNGTFLLQVVSKLQGTKLLFHAISPDRAALFSCAEDESTQTLLMPMKVE